MPRLLKSGLLVHFYKLDLVDLFFLERLGGIYRPSPYLSVSLCHLSQCHLYTQASLSPVFLAIAFIFSLVQLGLMRYSCSIIPTWCLVFLCLRFTSLLFPLESLFFFKRKSTCSFNLVESKERLRLSSKSQSLSTWLFVSSNWLSVLQRSKYLDEDSFGFSMSLAEGSTKQ